MTAFDRESSDVHDDLLAQNYATRDRNLRELGIADQDLLAPLLNPGLMGGPRWPSLRESWRRVARGRNSVVVSDGLSDPFDDDPEPNTGFGVEVLAETCDSIAEPVQRSWLFELVHDVSQQAADTGAFRGLVEELGLFSMELYLGEAFSSLRSPAGRVGVLLGLAPPNFSSVWQLPAGPVRIVTAKFLFPSELAFVEAGGRAGRQHLSDCFAADGTYHVCSFHRRPVV